MSQEEECPNDAVLAQIDWMFHRTDLIRNAVEVSTLANFTLMLKRDYESQCGKSRVSPYKGLVRYGRDMNLRILSSVFIMLGSILSRTPYYNMELIHCFKLGGKGEKSRKAFDRIKRRFQYVLREFHQTSLPLTYPSQYANRWLFQKQLSSETRGSILQLLEQIEGAEQHSPLADIVSRSSAPIAAAVIYAACRQSENIVDKYTQSQIAEITKVTEVTIRNNGNLLREHGLFDFEFTQNDPLAYENVYIVTNTQFEGSIKFGKSGNPVRSYRNLGRYSPNHPYVVEWYFPCNNSREVEASILEKLREEFDQPEYGTEWFNTGDVMRVKEIIETDEVYANNRQEEPVSPVYE